MLGEKLSTSGSVEAANEKMTRAENWIGSSLKRKAEETNPQDGIFGKLFALVYNFPRILRVLLYDYLSKNLLYSRKRKNKIISEY